MSKLYYYFPENEDIEDAREYEYEWLLDYESMASEIAEYNYDHEDGCDWMRIGEQFMVVLLDEDKKEIGHFLVIIRPSIEFDAVEAKE